MLYALAERGNFLTTWLVLTVLAFGLTMLMSGALFLRYYKRPTFETWQHKSNPQFPKPAMVPARCCRCSRASTPRRSAPRSRCTS